MSEQCLRDLALRAERDATFRTRLEESLSGKSPEEAASAFVAFARAEGFDVEPQEMAALLQPEGDLEDGTLDGVAGGKRTDQDWLARRGRYARG